MKVTIRRLSEDFSRAFWFLLGNFPEAEQELLEKIQELSRKYSDIELKKRTALPSNVIPFKKRRS